MKYISTLLLFLLFISSSFSQSKQLNSSEIKSALKKLNTVGSVLYIAAHPDDENTRLLSYLSNEKLLRTGYLSLTRGDGGQNLIGTEQGELLGMIRTQELLAARRIDGAEQFFTRANDFGFSKNPEETFSIWNKDSILADVVWVIRNFKPDLIITRFPTDGSGGHGHHTASAIIAEEAFDAAADPAKFPEQLKYVSVWKTKRLLWNGFNFPGRPQSDGPDFVKTDVGLYNTLLGKNYGEMASESRSQHRSQGFGVARQRGSNIETFKYIKGEKPVNTVFDGIDLSWNRIENSKKIQSLVNSAIKKYSDEKPSLIIPLLTQINIELKKLPDSYWKTQKIKETENLIVACAGLWFEATASDFKAVPGDVIPVTVSAINRSDVNIQLNQASFIQSFDTSFNQSLLNNQLFNYTKKVRIPSDEKFTNPYWLNEKHTQGLFIVKNKQLIGLPENLPSLKVKFNYTINGVSYTFEKPVVYKWTDPVKGELYRQLEIVPAVTASINAPVLIFSDDQPKKVKITLHSNTNNIQGYVGMLATSAWSIESNENSFHLTKKDEEQTLEFNIKPLAANISDNLSPIVMLDSNTSGTINNTILKSIERIEYDHIPTQTLLREVGVKLEKIDLKKKGTQIGYIVGAGDEIPESLKQMGYEVTLLTDEMLLSEDLNPYDAIVVGIRAYNTNTRMQSYYERLMEYVKNGGNMIVQYNTNNFISSVKSDIGPYPFKISRDRVTDENAEMRILKPDHPVLNTPNKITAKDFEGWVQERGIYFASDIDPKYETIFSCNDPGEKANEGSLILTKYGKGYFIYTGIAFFRQLPAGVPGAYRLFANLISVGK
jgi:LmbE family N-acetylglucosaminyl deacetylase